MTRDARKGNGHGHVTETPDVSHIKNVDVTHEASDVNVGSILKFALALMIFAVVVHVLMWGMFRFLNSREDTKEPQPGPMAMTKDERLPPEPRLQAAPGFGVKTEDGRWVPLENREPNAEYRVLRQRWDSKLTCVEPPPDDHSEKKLEPTKLIRNDQNSKGPEPGVCLPIDEAINQLVGTRVPSRPVPAEDIALPTASSSGRVTGRSTKQ